MPARKAITKPMSNDSAIVRFPAQMQNTVGNITE